jgi:hypothetical protein
VMGNLEPMLYVRKLYDQELGYRKGKPKQAGRYFFITKKVIPYFPLLSDWIRNDHVIVNVIPPNSNRIVLSNYVYHNDKIVDNKPNGRDEFRLYLNNDIDPGGDYFKSEDIIVISRLKIKDETIYKIFHYPVSKKGEEYEQLEKLIASTQIPGSHVLVPYSMVKFIGPFGDIKLEQKIIPKEIIEQELKASPELQPPPPLPPEIMEIEFKFTSVIREASFRDLLLYFYDYKCAITGNVMKYQGVINLQAAHIIPDTYGGPAHPKNGIPMSRDIHWAFDIGFFTIDNNHTIIVHEKVKDIPALKEINGRKMLLPVDQRAWPSEHSINWHNDKIYGLFLNRLE